uniref:Ig-like domain-containing protein n=1 Tax=Wuchereria bancrofti TaxID=6293 RepID=A0A1I8EZ72_WUCBA
MEIPPKIQTGNIDETIILTNVALEDDGFYHCISKSNAVQSIGSKRLIVNELRKDFNNLGAMNFGIFHKIEYCLPESRELRCALLAVPSYDHHVHKNAIGQPKPHITWIRNGTYLAGMLQPTDGYLILRVKIESNDDLGDYIEKASEIHGYSSKTFNCNIKLQLQY